VNVAATLLYQEATRQGDVILGDAVLVASYELAEMDWEFVLDRARNL